MNNSEMAAFDVNVEQSTTFILSDYVFRTLESTAKKMNILHHSEEKNFNLTFNFIGWEHNLKITNEDGVIKINIDFIATIDKVDIGFQLNADMEVTFTVAPGDKEYMAYITPVIDRDSVFFNITKYFSNGIEIGKRPLESKIEDALVNSVKNMKPKPIKIKNHKPPVTVVESEFRVFPTYSQLDFSFTMLE